MTPADHHRRHVIDVDHQRIATAMPADLNHLGAVIAGEVYAGALTITVEVLAAADLRRYSMTSDDTALTPTLVTALAAGHLGRALDDLNSRLAGADLDTIPTAPTFRR